MWTCSFAAMAISAVRRADNRVTSARYWPMVTSVRCGRKGRVDVRGAGAFLPSEYRRCRSAAGFQHRQLAQQRNRAGDLLVAVHRLHRRDEAEPHPQVVLRFHLHSQIIHPGSLPLLRLHGREQRRRAGATRQPALPTQFAAGYGSIASTSNDAWRIALPGNRLYDVVPLPVQRRRHRPSPQLPARLSRRAEPSTAANALPAHR